MPSSSSILIPPWKVALRTNEGLAYYPEGYFDRAIAALSEAWKLGKNEKDVKQKALVDRAIGELIKMHARLGHADQLARLLNEIKDRPLTGPATEWVAGAKEGLWQMRHNPGVAYLCGPMALKHVLRTVDPENSKVAILDRFRSGPHGVDLATVQKLAKQVGLDYRMAYRTSTTTSIPLPAMVHWKVSHYAAIVGFDHGRYHLQDPTFGHDLWITPAALDAESDGYFLIPAKELKSGWQPVTMAQAKQVYGMGITFGNDPNATSPYDANGCCSVGNGSGMPVANAKAMVVSLSFTDTPLSYTPPKGPKIEVTLTYSQREATQPANFNYFNLGPKWNFNWLAFIQDNPTLPGAGVMHMFGGGGALLESGYNSVTGTFAPESLEGAVLTRTSGSSYALRYPDGRIEIFARSDNAPHAPRRIFLTQVIDPQGNAVTLNYDTQLRLVSLTDALGQVTTFQYGNAENPLLITGVTDPFGRSMSIGYDTQGRLASLTDVIGLTSSFEYDAGSFIQAMTTPYGTSHFAYGDGANTERFLTLTDPLGNTQRLEFRLQAPGIAYTEAVVPTGMATVNAFLYWRNSFFWNAKTYAQSPNDYPQARIYHWTHDHTNPNVASRTLESMKDPLENRVWYNYPGQSQPFINSALDLPTAVGRVLDNGASEVTHYVRNSLGNVTDYLDPAGRETRYTYASNGIDVLKVEQKNGAGFDTIAQYTYNAQHEPLTSTDAAGQTTQYAYNGAGQLILLTDPLGHTTQYVYDANGYLTQIVDANGKVAAAFTYDALGRVATATDAGGETIAFTYDALDRTTKITYPDGTSRTYAYDKLDLASYTDRLGHTTQYDYDADRNLVAVTDPLGNTVHLSYDADRQLVGLTDANGNATSWTRDIENRILHKQYADGGMESRAYGTGDGRLKTVTDPLGQITLYGYTIEGRLASINYQNALTPTPAVSFSYNPFYPRIDSMADGTGTTHYGYYPAGVVGANQLAQELVPTPQATIAYSYDALGRMASRSLDALTENFQYDGIGRLTQYQNPLGAFSYTYLGETYQIISQQPISGPLHVRYRYESNTDDRRLKAILNLVHGQGHHPQSFRYRTDAESLITRITVTAEGNRGRGDDEAESEGKSFDDRHDGDKKSENDRDDGDSAFHGTSFYTYDAANRLMQTKGHPLGRSDYDYDSADNLLSITGKKTSFTASYNNLNEITAANSQAFTYDTAGELLNDGHRQYVWDAAHRLVSVTDTTTGAVTRYQYDGLSRRVAIASQASPSATPVTKNYLWCGETLCQTRDAGNTVLTTYYAQGQLNGNQPQYYARNHLGSVMNLLNASGKTLASYAYTPYGRTLAEKSSSGQSADFRYAGMFYDTTTGLYLTHYRAYDPNIRRWLSRDPLGEAGEVNLYLYANANPLRYTDSSGLYVGIDDLVFTGGGAVVGLLGQGLSDVLAGRVSGWEDYTGAAIGGAAGGEALLYTGPVGAGAIGGAVTNLAKQGLKTLSGKSCDFNYGSLLQDTVVGGALGFIPGIKIPGVTAGQGSFNSIYKQIVTKATSGQISSVTPLTAAKMFTGRAVDTSLLPASVAAAGYDARNRGTDTSATSCQCQK